MFRAIATEKPSVVFVGGDIFPSIHNRDFNGIPDFIDNYFKKKLIKLRKDSGKAFPVIYLIMGNDDPRAFVADIEKLENEGLIVYMHNRVVEYKGYLIFGYANVPPTPFLLKDWERYDVSRYIDPGCIPPTSGFRTAEEKEDIEYATIAGDLDILIEGREMEKAVFLFHTPPYKSKLDRAALDGKFYDHVPLDVHVGSIAVARMIEEKQPMLTLHGHIHESSSITGEWQQIVGRTISFSAAYDQQSLAIVKFDLEKPVNAKREIC